MMEFRCVPRRLRLLGAAVCVVCLGACSTSEEVSEKASEEALTLAPGWGELGYELPQPGTYELPVIRGAAGGKVLKADGSAADLGDLLNDKITVLNFIYTSCNDVNGCPLSIFVMHQLQDRLKREPGVVEHLQLISLSFDVKNDTPEVLRAFQQEHGTHAGDYAGREHHSEDHAEHGGQMKHDQTAQNTGADWSFVVSASERDLAPLLKAYSQFLIPEINENQEKTGQFSHLLRVFLIDKHKRIRNIYSPDFLHPDMLLADTKTLLLMDGDGPGDGRG